MIETFKTRNKTICAYEYTRTKNPKACVMFLPGYASTMNKTKPQFLKLIAPQYHLSSFLMDLSCHGQSTGEMDSFTLTKWLYDIDGALDLIQEDKVILVGSSFGGWLSILTALRHPKKMIGLVGIAAAADFAKDVYESFSENQRGEMQKSGRLEVPSKYEDPYIYTQQFFDDAMTHLVLDKDLNLPCPSIFLHGLRDDVVSPKTSQKIVQQNTHPDCTLINIKDGDHSLSRDQDLVWLEFALRHLTA